MELKPWSRVIAGALIVSTAFLLAACTRSETFLPSPTTSAATATTVAPSPTATTDPEVVAAQAAILKAYRGYWATKVAILADPSVEPGPELETYAVDTALTDVYSTVLRFRSDRIIMIGAPVLEPKVSEIVPGPDGTATITDCVDVANWQPLFRDTREAAAAPGQATRVTANASAYFYMDRWTVRTYVVDRDTPC